MFEKAVREKVRFNYKGVLSVEDLWDLRPAELDNIYKILNANLKDTQEESLLEEQTDEDELLRLQVELVKHIVKVKLAEKKANEEKVEKAVKKQKILSVIAKKQDEALLEMSEDELKKLVEEM